LVIVSASLDFDVTSNLFHGGEHRTLVISAGESVPSDDLLEVADVVALRNDHGFAESLVDALAKMNILKITCEGGPTLLTKLLEAKMVNEYDLTVSPITVGGAPKWPKALPLPEDWEEVAGGRSGEFEFKRLLRRS
jgi:riboflavin biosynthesis pyrimidine reductase